MSRVVVVVSRRRTRNSVWYSDFGTWKAFFFVCGLLHYIVWVVTLVVCSTDRSLVRGANNNNSNNNDKYYQLSLFFPLDVYAWSVGQMLLTLGMRGRLSEVLTKKAWESFEQRDSRRSSTNTTNTTTNTDKNTILSPLPIPVLHVQDFLHNNYGSGDDQADAAVAARSFLEENYGSDWRETPVLLKGLWTVAELVGSGSSASSSTTQKTITTTRRRRLTPHGLLQMDDLRLHYFSDATKKALEPDAIDSVSTIVRSMLVDKKPYKIGSQWIVQHYPELLEEVAPLGFLHHLLGDHFTKNHLMGNPSRTGWRSFLPGTTTVPVFVANTGPILFQTTTTHGDESMPISDNPCHSDNDSDIDIDADTKRRKSANNSCANPNAPSTNANTTTTNTNTNNTASTTINSTTTTIPKQNPFTGLHCEPIANVAVQLWGSRTWTLVDPHHSWKLRPSISRDGRSYYPSNISPESLLRIPRYVTTTTPGDAIWLPTWTYHKVDYVYHHHQQQQQQQQQQQTSSSSSSSNDAGRDDTAKDENENAILHQHQLSIGASLFHFRPIDYVRRNPLFALLLIPSLVKELLDINTQ